MTTLRHCNDGSAKGYYVPRWNIQKWGDTSTWWNRSFFSWPSPAAEPISIRIRQLLSSDVSNTDRTTVRHVSWMAKSHRKISYGDFERECILSNVRGEKIKPNHRCWALLNNKKIPLLIQCWALPTNSRKWKNKSWPFHDFNVCHFYHKIEKMRTWFPFVWLCLKIYVVGHNINVDASNLSLTSETLHLPNANKPRRKFQF